VVELPEPFQRTLSLVFQPQARIHARQVLKRAPMIGVPLEDLAKGDGGFFMAAPPRQRQAEVIPDCERIGGFCQSLEGGLIVAGLIRRDSQARVSRRQRFVAPAAGVQGDLLAELCLRLGQPANRQQDGAEVGVGAGAGRSQRDDSAQHRDGVLVLLLVAERRRKLEHRILTRVGRLTEQRDRASQHDLGLRETSQTAIGLTQQHEPLGPIGVLPQCAVEHRQRAHVIAAGQRLAGFLHRIVVCDGVGRASQQSRHSGEQHAHPEHGR
jgi:hypothetical protein